MSYLWTHHALQERLPERSSLTRFEIEGILSQQVFVVTTRFFNTETQNFELPENHFIWDPGIHSLINVPLRSYSAGSEKFFIPTVLPLNEDSGFEPHLLAMAEAAWLGRDYYREEELYSPVISRIKVQLIEYSWSNDGRVSKVCTTVLDEHLYEELDDAEKGRFLPLLRYKPFIANIKGVLENESKLDDKNTSIRIIKSSFVCDVPATFFLEAP